jgi:membrane fusion protein (multidrug efflux system)
MSEEKIVEKNLPVKKRYIFIFLAAIAVLAGAYFIYDMLGYQSTDDAYVETTTVSVSPKVAGEIVKVLVKDNQAIKGSDRSKRLQG